MPPLPGLGSVVATADRSLESVSVDCEVEIRYDPSLVLDGRPGTAWGVPGSGEGVRIYLDLGGRYRIGRVGLIPGYAKTDPCTGIDRFSGNRVVESVRWTFDDGTEVLQELRPEAAMQEIDVDVVASRVEVEILSSGYHPQAVDPEDDTLISEITLMP